MFIDDGSPEAARSLFRRAHALAVCGLCNQVEVDRVKEIIFSYGGLEAVRITHQQWVRVAGEPLSSMDPTKPLQSHAIEGDICPTTRANRLAFPAQG